MDYFSIIMIIILITIYVRSGVLTLWAGSVSAQSGYRPAFPLAPPGGTVLGGQDVSASIPGNSLTYRTHGGSVND
jgi:hypothetical protein